jgi:outer membrane lipoprotein-sorting protein
MPRPIARPLLAAVLFTLTVPALAQEPPKAEQPPKPGPAANPNVPANVSKAIADMAAAQQALNSYSATIDVTVKQGPMDATVRSDFAYAKPGKVYIAANDSVRKATRTIISDGKDMYGIDTSDPKMYRKVTAQATPNNISLALRNSGGSTLGLLGLLIQDPDAKDKILPPTVSAAALKPDEKLDGMDVSVISADFPGPGTSKISLLLHVGKADNLLRRITLNVADGESKTTVIESFTNVKVNPTLPESRFVFTPGPDQKPYSAIPATPPKGDAPPAKPEAKP